MSNSGFLPGPRAIHRRRASSDWWMVAGQTCVAAYQPKGAASLAASYVNLANPGTYDAAPGTAPAFDMATGWTFAAASSQYLTTGITPAADWSAIVRFSNAENTGTFNFLFGSQGADVSDAPLFGIFPIPVGGFRAYHQSGLLNKTDPITGGILAIAGRTAYNNGSAESGEIGTRTGTQWRSIYIGCRNGGLAQLFVSAKIQAIAIYKPTEPSTTPMSADDVAALTTRMAAL